MACLIARKHLRLRDAVERRWDGALPDREKCGPNSSDADSELANDCEFHCDGGFTAT